MMTFMSRPLSSASGWNDDRDASSVPGGAGDVHLAAEEQRPLVHAEQAQRLPAVQVALADADAVVMDFERDLLVGDAEVDVHARGARMARHVGQDLLEDAERGGGYVDVELGRLRRQLHPATDAGALLELL